MGSWPVYDGLNGIFPAPLEVLTKKRRPLRFMIGTVTREFPTYLNDSTILSVYEACLMATVLKGFKNKLAISAACAVHYTKHSYDDSNSYQPDGINSRIDTAVVSVLNDVGIYNPTYEDAKSHTENGGTSFLYEFEYARKGEENFTPYHSYDLTFVTGNHWDRINLTETDQQIRDIYVDLFSNFAKFGNPTPGIKHTKSNPRWYPLGPDGAANYFAINLPAPKNKVSYHYEGNLFWDTLAPAVDQMFTSDKRSGPFVSNLVAIQDAPAAESNSTGANNTALIATIVGVACLIVGIMLAVVGMKMRNRKNKNDSEKKLLLQENLQYQTFQQI